MTVQVTITGKITGIFDKSKFKSMMEGLSAIPKKQQNQYVIGSWEINGINVILYEKSIVFQCKVSADHEGVISKITAFDGIELDIKNRDLLSSFLPRRQNAIVCNECLKPSLTITAEKDSLQVKFKKECSHSDNLDKPFFTINYRVLPDINILVSRSLSRLIELGHFSGFEIIIPRVLSHIVDMTNNAGIKKGFSEEISALKSLESGGKIRVIDFDDKYKTDELDQHNEDSYLSDISDITNSILITGDELLKSKVQLKNRPVIFIPPELHSHIKTSYESRMN